MSKAGPIILEYEPRQHRFRAWWQRNHWRVVKLSIACLVATVLWRSDISYDAWTVDHSSMCTATRFYQISVGKFVIRRWNEPARFIYADVVAPASGSPGPDRFINIPNRNVIRHHFGFHDSRVSGGLKCLSGMRQLFTFQDGIRFVSKRMPDANPEQRRDVLFEILRRTGHLDRSWASANEAEFSAIAEQVLKEFLTKHQDQSPEQPVTSPSTPP